ncbi:MAG: ATPase domain-containing protein, partial [Actinomycetota bacterium]
MTGNHDVDPMGRLGTASPILDQLLGGGLPERSVTVVAGEPGAGKTIFTLQLIFHLARQGLNSLYFTTLSEPALKVIRYMQLFSFFDQQLLDDRIIFADLGAALRTKDTDGLLQQIVNRVEQEEPAMVAIDSFRAIHELLGERRLGREFVYDLAVQMAGWGATTLLVGEYTAGEIAQQPEFSIADGIIRLTNKRQELTAVREMEVVKLRGANYMTGAHFFEIGQDGLIFYPRIRGPEIRAGRPGSIADRASSGVQGLDELLNGGVPRHSATLLQGGSGTGKTLLGLHFLVEG